MTPHGAPSPDQAGSNGDGHPGRVRRPRLGMVQPDGLRVRELREARDWTQETLAEKAEFSKRTIESIEAGERVKRGTLEAVARALGTTLEAVCVQAPRKGTVLELLLDRPLCLTEANEKDFLRALRERLSLSGPIRVLNTPSGRLVLTLKLTAADGGRLWQGFLEDRLGDLHVWDVRPIGTTAPEQDGVRVDPARQSLPAPHAAVNPAPCSLLVVDDEPYILDYVKVALRNDFEVLTADSAAAAEEVFRRRPVDLILADQRMPGRTGVELLEWVREHYPRTVRLLMSGFAEIEDTIEAINRGQVYHYVRKPWPTDLLDVLRHAAEKFTLERELEREREQLRRSQRKLRKVNRRLRRQLEREASTDPLTGVYNRWAIEGQAHREVQASLRYRHALSIGLVDVDPSCLSPEGPLQAATEEVVRRLACILDRSVREVDSVGRLEGARFLIVARETEERGAARLAERIRAQVEATPFPCRGQTTPLTVSLGFAVAPGETAFALEDMTRVAEDALAEARKAGGNRRVVRTVPPAAHGG